MAKRLEGKVALVTGASSGIGEATAIALAEEGARVAVTARRRDRLDKLAVQLAGLGAEPLVLEADLLDETQAQRVVRETEAHFGRLDVLVNNAGVMYLEPVAEADLGRWRQMLELNVLSLIASTQAALAGMTARGDGHVVNISSTAGRIANPNAAAYSATKFGVVAFSEALRREVYRHGIRVSVIEPGVVQTELRDHIGHAATRDALNAWADGMRQLQSRDVAEAIAFCVTRPPHVNINEILMRPTDQER
ncbi:oxidoreductase [Rhodanobacter sp. FW510-R12]|uniref:SDR family NAD(P)-dependent oxidoreductase n=1 Tax=unclassified Rhodanobacter TaxID=2621553 RepID=UPI0007A9F90C|nr:MULTISPECIES: SDR family NAD(P)-dependent oxidoreductase [unclassified Rhodanobacter]KZC16444.1 oxidoreductase [Rhodanobacter sp. FW104-R8]KZC28812.1 oxidoreductase [Rhodanobacter sp. FW510-T8]KZC31458.1 oxidoreductase [Rhodanobacter sp. FW510-R10]